MRFTQFIFPNGRRQDAFIDMPPETEAKALELERAGWAFEIECHPDTQIVHMDCCDPDEALANRLCRNGPDVPVKVGELVNAAHGTWVARGMPKASREAPPPEEDPLFEWCGCDGDGK